MAFSAFFLGKLMTATTNPNGMLLTVIVFVIVNLYITTSLVFIQIFAYGGLLISHLATPLNDKFTKIIKLTQKSFCGMVIFFVFFLCPPSLVLSGDYEQLVEEKAIVIANHQIYPVSIYSLTT
jgi:hypothetical protein